jgi:hypothetical protein
VSFGSTPFSPKPINFTARGGIHRKNIKTDKELLSDLQEATTYIKGRFNGNPNREQDELLRELNKEKTALKKIIEVEKLQSRPIAIRWIHKTYKKLSTPQPNIRTIVDDSYANDWRIKSVKSLESLGKLSKKEKQEEYKYPATGDIHAKINDLKSNYTFQIFGQTLEEALNLKEEAEKQLAALRKLNSSDQFLLISEKEKIVEGLNALCAMLISAEHGTNLTAAIDDLKNMAINDNSSEISQDEITDLKQKSEDVDLLRLLVKHSPDYPDTELGDADDGANNSRDLLGHSESSNYFITTPFKTEFDDINEEIKDLEDLINKSSTLNTYENRGAIKTLKSMTETLNKKSAYNFPDFEYALSKFKGAVQDFKNDLLDKEISDELDETLEILEKQKQQLQKAHKPKT